MDRMVVNPVLCQGCGACAAACPNGAAVVQGFGEGQILETIDAALEG
jgi:heterodisulfide reductase subunit A